MQRRSIVFTAKDELKLIEEPAPVPKSGELLWSAGVGEPVVFQPAVAGGKVYVSTSSGSLYCLDTGDVKDDGWLMWGANAAHNGTVK